MATVDFCTDLAVLCPYYHDLISSAALALS